MRLKPLSKESVGPRIGEQVSVVLANGAGGILAQGAVVLENIVALNTNAGLSFSSQQGLYVSGYARNVIGGNGSTVPQDGKQTGPNVCNGSSTCP